MRQCLAALLAAALAAALAGPHPAAAQDFPTRPITLIVPYTPGGGNDAMARVVADKMSVALRQQIVIENRGGAGGSIATRQVARATPDGYTLGLGGTGTLAIDPTLYPNVGYDPRKDFAPVGLIATSALIVLVNPSVPAKTLEEFIALAKAEPGKIDFASAGSGSGIHLGTELLAYMAGIKMTHIPYKGSAPALTDLIGGHVALYFSSLPPAIGLVREGKVRAARGHRADAREGISGHTDGGASGAARLRGGPALRHRGAGRHPAAGDRQAQCGDADGARHRRTFRPASIPTAPRSSPARPSNTPPTSIARRPSGRTSCGGRERRRSRGRKAGIGFDEIEASLRVIAGLVPAISIRRAQCRYNRDGRDKPGHDGSV